MTKKQDEALELKVRKGCNVVIIIAVIIGGLFWFSYEEEPEKPLTPEEQRIKRIEECFNPWDGSHVELTKMIKESMNDPDSYEHIQTTYTDIGLYSDVNDRINIKMSFRGKNAFGGIVKQTVYAVTDLNCNIIEISED